MRPGGKKTGRDKKEIFIKNLKKRGGEGSPEETEKGRAEETEKERPEETTKKRSRCKTETRLMKIV